MDRYRIGKEQISTSTMHKIHDKEFELDDFSHEHLYGSSKNALMNVIDVMNASRSLYLESKKTQKDWWWQMIQLLPSSYNQKRTVMFSYETLLKIYKERKDHKLDEWRTFTKFIEEAVPYFTEFI